MLFAQPRKFNRTVTRVLTILVLALASVLVFASAPGSVAANSGRRVGHAERSNHRIRVSPVAAAANAVQPMNFPLPFAPIDVDRTDDTAAASACTAAANDLILATVLRISAAISGVGARSGARSQ